MIRILITLQALVALVFALGFGWWRGASAAVAAGAGGLICIIPNLFLLSRLFAHNGARAARKILMNFYLGELGKLLLTAGLFYLAFGVFKLSPVPLLVTFGACYLSISFAAFIKK